MMTLADAVTPPPISDDTRGIILEAEQGALVSPFMAQNGYIVSSVRTTDPAVNTSKATFTFDIPSRDNYRVELLLDAPFNFDMFASMDGSQPSKSHFIGEDQRTNGYEWRSIYWGQSNGSNILDLSSGRHELVIYGGTANVKIDKVRIIRMVDKFTTDPAPSSVISGGTAIMGTGLNLLGQDRIGCYLPSSYYVCGIRSGLSKFDMVVKLPGVLKPGTYYLFVKGSSGGGFSASIGSRSTAVVVPNSSDISGLWTALGSITVDSDQYYAVITTHRVGVVTTNENSLIYGIYITNNPNESLTGADVIVTAQPPDSVPSPTIAGNLIPNSGFEVGTLGDWMFPGRTGALSQNVYNVIPFSSYWDQSVSHSGNASMKIPTNRISATRREVYQFIHSRPFYLKASTQYTFSVWAKTSPGKTVTVDMGFENVSDPAVKVERRVAVNSTWQRFTITGDTTASPAPNYRIKLLVFGGDVVTWFDDMQLEEGAGTAYEPSHPLEAGLHLSTPGHVFYEDEPVLATMHIHNISESSVSQTVQYEVYDYRNKLVRRDSEGVTLDPGAHTTRQIDLGTGKRGAFRVLYWVVGQNGSDKEIAYSIVPRPIQGDLNLSYMGVHLNVAESQFAFSRKLGITWARSLSTADFFRWSFVEPQDDTFVWAFDDEIQQMYNSGMGFLGTFNTPATLQTWMRDANGRPRLDKWEDYIRQVVSHNKQWVKYWEIENEPNHRWPASHYAQMLKIAVDTIESLDPSAKIVAMGGTPYTYMHGVVNSLDVQYPSWNWREHIDVFSTHAYPGGTSAEIAGTEIVARYGMPVWNTETGAWDLGSFVGPFSRYVNAGTQLYPFKDAEMYYRAWLKKPEAVVQNFLLSIGGGQTRYFYYDLEHSQHFWIRMIL